MRLIDADAFERKCMFDSDIEDMQDVIYALRDYSTVPAIPIPEGATNGDVLKRLLYGKAIITEFIHDVNISVNNNVIGQLDMEWWNSPYKRGDMK